MNEPPRRGAGSEYITDKRHCPPGHDRAEPDRRRGWPCEGTNGFCPAGVLRCGLRCDGGCDKCETPTETKDCRCRLRYTDGGKGERGDKRSEDLGRKQESKPKNFGQRKLRKRYKKRRLRKETWEENINDAETVLSLSLRRKAMRVLITQACIITKAGRTVVQRVTRGVTRHTSRLARQLSETKDTTVGRGAAACGGSKKGRWTENLPTRRDAGLRVCQLVGTLD